MAEGSGLCPGVDVGLQQVFGLVHRSVGRKPPEIIRPLVPATLTLCEPRTLADVAAWFRSEASKLRAAAEAHRSNKLVALAASYETRADEYEARAALCAS